MPCCMLDVKPLPELLLTCCELHLKMHISMKICWKCKCFYSRNAFDNDVLRISAILFRLPCVKHMNVNYQEVIWDSGSYWIAKLDQFKANNFRLIGVQLLQCNDTFGCSDESVMKYQHAEYMKYCFYKAVNQRDNFVVHFLQDSLVSNITKAEHQRVEEFYWHDSLTDPSDKFYLHCANIFSN